MKRKSTQLRVLIVVIFTMMIADLHAQQYRPRTVDWYQLKTEHFNILYPQNEKIYAERAAEILEQSYPNLSSYTGGKLSNLNVILNSENDRSNGFVTSYNFRMEVEMPVFKGKSLNPQTGTWFENVLPHELVHAAHINNVPWIGLGGALKLLYPDAGRSLHFSAPSGFLEGIAVHKESQWREMSGRGNYGWFTNQYNSIMRSDDAWSLGTSVSTVTHNQPGNRHYLGGYQWYHFLQKKYGEEVVDDVIDLTTRIPFTGHGVHVWMATGTWPGKDWKAFREEEKERFENENQSVKGKIIDFSPDGERVRQPLWDEKENTLLFYLSSYSEKPGFFRYHPTKDKLERIKTTSSVSDFEFDLHPKTGEFFYSRYKPEPTTDATSKARIYSFKNGKSEIVKSVDRVWHPSVYYDDETGKTEIHALQTFHNRNNWVSITNNRVDKLYTAKTGEELVSIHPNPAPYSKQFAVIINRGGDQSVYLVERDEITSLENQKPILSRPNNAFFDVNWSSDGSSFLFTMDDGNSMQIGEFVIEDSAAYQLTQNVENSFEPAYGDEDQIFYVIQQRHEQKLVMVNRSMLTSEKLQKISQKSEKKTSEKHKWLAEENSTIDKDKWEHQPHKDYSWLVRPRGIIPIWNTDSGELLDDQFGFAAVGMNALNTHYYQAEATFSNSEVWTDITWNMRSVYPGTTASVFRTPFEVTNRFSLPDQTDPLPVSSILSRAGFEAGLEFPYLVDQNVFTTYSYLRPTIKWYQQRLVTSNLPVQYSGLGSVYADEGWAVNVLGSFHWNMYQHQRDMQPMQGTVLFAEMEQDISHTSDVFGKRSGITAGIAQYVPVWESAHQSLKFQLKGLWQSDAPAFSATSFASDLYDSIYDSDYRRMVSFETRYTIPFGYPENGGFVIPWYLQNMYGVLFMQSIGDMNDVFQPGNLYHLAGAGVRVSTGFTQFRIDIGISWVFDMFSNEHSYYIGDF